MQISLNFRNPQSPLTPLFQRGGLFWEFKAKYRLHNAPSLEKWMSSVAAQGWIALNRNPYIKRCVDTYAQREKELSDIIDQSKMAVFVLTDWHYDFNHLF